MKIRPVGAELFHADRRTDGYDKANSGSSQLCERRAYKQTGEDLSGFCVMQKGCHIIWKAAWNADPKQDILCTAIRSF